MTLMTVGKHCELWVYECYDIFNIRNPELGCLKEGEPFIIIGNNNLVWWVVTRLGVGWARSSKGYHEAWE